jgi:poly-gamma-glutamate synthesis protein (capsule biosynthesis protein)
VAIGARWFSPALDWDDPRLSLPRAEAEAWGLEELEAISLPRRAAAVDGLWPGEPEYPFRRELRLSLEGKGGKAPHPRLRRWLEEAAAAYVGGQPGGGGAGRPFILAATGDMEVKPGEHGRLIEGEAGLARLLGSLLPRMRAADLLVGNLEAVISDRGSANPEKRFLFRMPSASVAALKAAGFDLLLFANNHIFDYGQEAFEDSLRLLEEGGLPQVGAGMDIATAAAPRLVEAPDGSRLAFIGFASYPQERYGWTAEKGAAGEGRPGHNSEEAATLAAIAAARAEGAIPIVLAHGGAEYQFQPSPGTMTRYAAFIDAGAMAVLGSHPHLLQGLSARGEGLIAWSLGNFLFTGEDEPAAARDSAMLELLWFAGRPRGFRIVPVRVEPEGSDLNPDPAAVEAAFMARTAELARAAGRP